MKFKHLYQLAFLIGILIASSCNQPKKEVSSTKQDLPFWDQLVGKWKQDGKNIFEEWSKEDTIYTGRVYQLRNGTKIGRETIIVDIAADTIKYKVTVLNQNEGKPVNFMLKKLTSNSAVFVNGEHDFPQTIKYSMIDSTRMEAVTSGRIQGKDKVIRFYYTRQ